LTGWANPRCQQSCAAPSPCWAITFYEMAPAMLLARQARFVDLDGPLLLARDRDGGLRYDGSLVYPPEAALWG